MAIFCALGLMDDVANEFKGMPVYYKMLLQYQYRAVEYLRKDIGFVRATVGHFYHGDKDLTRFYGERNLILDRYNFDPTKDLKKDIQGLWQLEVRTDRQIGFRDEMRDYMLFARNEDSVTHRQLPQSIKGRIHRP